MPLSFTHYLEKEFGEIILCLLILEGMLNIVLRALEVCALEISLNIPFMCEEKKLMSRDQNALTTSLPLNYSFMLKCCRSPIILLMKTHCNGMHAAYKLICTHTLIQFTGRFLSSYLHSMISIYLHIQNKIWL